MGDTYEKSKEIVQLEFTGVEHKNTFDSDYSGLYKFSGKDHRLGCLPDLLVFYDQVKNGDQF